MHALFVRHRTEAGQREKVAQIWCKHMAPAIEANPDHLLYVYSFGEQADEICAFQVYSSIEAAADFLDSPSYQAYLEEVAPHLQHRPDVTVLRPEWLKLPSESFKPNHDCLPGRQRLGCVSDR